MDISTIPARAELAVPNAVTVPRLKAATHTGRPETANPVTAPDRAEAAAQPQAQSIKPLDVFQVGDNDDVPVPPEPPRQSLALVAFELPEPSETDEAVGETQPADGSKQAVDTPEMSPTDRPAQQAQAPSAPYQSPSPERSPTVDIRR